MVNTISAILAGRTARDLLVTARRPDGGYDLPAWPDARRGRSDSASASRAVARLRVVQRLLVGFLDPVEDALYLTAGLRRLGYAASFHLGRELAPAIAPGGFHAWVQCGGCVVSTSLPVRDEYVPVYSSE
jgi:Transglutaminase-like superfamily